jgi:quercetin dioxygenase-like cupin family protein
MSINSGPGSASARIIQPLDRPKAMKVAGFDIQALITGNDAESYEVCIISGNMGKGPPPHSHPWDETYLVLRGFVVIGIGKEEDSYGVGAIVHIPGGQRHWFRFDQEGEVLDLTSDKHAVNLYKSLSELPADAAEIDYAEAALRNGQVSLPEN